MIVVNPTDIKIGAASWKLRAGQVVPTPVLKHWQAKNQIDRLLAQGTIRDETAPAPKTRKPVIKTGAQAEDPA